VQLIKQVTQLT